MNNIFDLSICNFKELLNIDCVFFGWINNIRDTKNIIFFDIRFNNHLLQCILNKKKNKKKIISYINFENFVFVYGMLILRKNIYVNNNIKNGEYELCVTNINLYSKCKLKLPFSINKYNASKHDEMKYRYLSLRPVNGPITSIIKKTDMFNSIRQIMKDYYFSEIYTPLLSYYSPDGAKSFIVPSREYKMFYSLPQSPQQYKQLMMIGGVSKYFQIAPCFRNEDSRHDRYPGEFYQLDIEISFVQQYKELFYYAKNIIYDLVQKFCTNKIINSCSIKYEDSIRYYNTDKPNIKVPMIQYDNDVKYIIVSNNCLNYLKSQYNNNINICKSVNNNEIRDDHSIIILPEIIDYHIMQHIQYFYNNLFEYISLVFVYDYPMFEISKENKIVFKHNPFCMPYKETIQNDVNLIKCKQFDVVVNGFEVGSGSLRNDNYNLLKKVFNIAGYKNEFNHFFNAFKYGTPPHGGFALGIERLMLSLNIINNIQSSYIFPLNQNGNDLMFNSPSKIKKSLLKEYGIKCSKRYKP